MKSPLSFALNPRLVQYTSSALSPIEFGCNTAPACRQIDGGTAKYPNKETEIPLAFGAKKQFFSENPVGKTPQSPNDSFLRKHAFGSIRFRSVTG